jgi:DNA-binding transcriptional ArsR family regulator
MSETPDCNHDSATSPAVSPEGVLERAAAILRAAGDPGRLRLLELLRSGERCVTELADFTGDSLSTISARLRVLRSERLLTRRRDGKHQYYSLADHHIDELLQGVFEHAAEEEPK